MESQVETQLMYGLPMMFYQNDQDRIIFLQIEITVAFIIAFNNNPT